MNVSTANGKSIYSFMELLAQKSGEIINEYYNHGFAVEIKDDNSPVTAADRESEQCMRDLIHKEFPGHGIIGEEFGNEHPNAEYVWILDPIDGTKSFVSRAPLFGTLIGLLYNGSPIAGVINNPVLNLFIYGDNNTTLENGKKIHCRNCNKIAEAVLCTSDPLNHLKYQNGKGFENLAQSVKVYRTWGDCFGYYLLAAGHIDIMVDPVMNPWDSLPLIPILRGSGVTVTDYHGKDPVRNADSMAATVPELHTKVISLLNENSHEV